MSGSGSSCHSSCGIFLVADSHELVLEACPFSSPKAFCLVSVAVVGDSTIDHRAKIGFIGFPWCTPRNYSPLMQPLWYTPQSTFEPSYVAIMKPVHCFDIQYWCGLTHATSNKNFATSWEKESCLLYVRYDLADGNIAQNTTRGTFFLNYPLYCSPLSDSQIDVPVDS